MKHYIFSLLFLLFGSSICVAQIDTSFWFVAPEVWIGHDDRPIYLRFASFDEAAEIVINQPANPNFPEQNLSLSANDAQSIDLTLWIDMIENKPINQVLNYGIKISSTSPITAYYEEGSLNNPDIFSLKGSNALGTEFFTPFQTFLNNNYSQSKAGIDIVASEDSTSIDITPGNFLVSHPPNETFTITLNKGQTYSLRSSSTLGSLHPDGTHIVSNKPIAVTISDDSVLGNPYYGNLAFDLIGDQLIPVEQMGLEYIAIKGELNGPDKIYITASQDNTDIFIGGTFMTNINTGESYEISLSSPSVYFSSSKPIVALHMTGYGAELCGAILPPINCTGSQNVSFIRSENNPFFKLNILVKSGGEDDFSFNGDVNLIQSTNFFDVPNTSGEWKYASISNPSFVSVLANSNITNSTSFFHVGIIMGRNSSSRYGYFSNYNKFQHQITSSSESYCEGEELILNGEFLPTTDYNWQGPNNFTAFGNNYNFGTLSLQDSGVYTLSGQIDECEVISDTIHIFINPLDDASFNITDFCLNSTNEVQITGIQGGVFSLLNSTDQAIINDSTGNISNASINSSYEVLYETNSNCPNNSIQIVNVLPFEDASFTTSDFCFGDTNSVTIIGVDNGLFTLTQNPNGAMINPLNGQLTGVSPNTTYSIHYQSPGVNNYCSNTSEQNVTVFSIPENPIVNPILEYCQNETILPITILPSSPNSVINWYTDSNLDSLIINSNTYTIPSFLGSTLVYVTESSINNCESSFTQIEQIINPLPSIDAGADQFLCWGEDISLTANGALNYIWNNGIQNDTPFNPPLGQNIYIVTGTDEHNCLQSDTILISVYPNPEPFAGNDLDICGNSITLQASDNNNTGLWTSNTVTFENQNSPNSLANINTYGLHTLYWTEINDYGCQSSDTILLNFLEIPVNTLSTDSLVICNYEEVILNGSSNNSSNPTWTTNGTGQFIPNSTHIVYQYSQEDLKNDQLQVYFTSNLGNCYDTDTISIRIQDLPITELSTDQYFCELDSTIMIYVKNQGVSPFKYTLTHNGLDISTHISENYLDTLYISQEGNFNITHFNDAYCQGINSTDLNIFMRPNPLANFTVYPRETSISDALIHMNNFTLNAENCLWSFGDNSLTNTDCNPNHQYLEEGTYEIQLLVENEFGCIDSMTQKVVIHPNFDIFIPNAFTPDNDNVNDTFICKGFGFDQFNLSIFNRWGELIFLSNDLDLSWDGSNKRGEICMNGVYSYKIVVLDLIGKEHTILGEISLIR